MPIADPGPAPPAVAAPEAVAPEAVAPEAAPEAAPGPDASLRMVTAAVDAFSAHGFHATTTRDIAARAGLSPAALYVHFPSKAALLAEISLHGHRTALDLVTAAASGAEPVTERLRRLVSAFASWHAEHHRVARVVHNEYGALPDAARGEIAAIRRRIEQAVEDLITTGIAEGSLQADQPRRVARALLSLCVDVARWFDPAGRDSPQELGDLYADLAVRMVSPQRAGDAVR